MTLAPGHVRLREATQEIHERLHELPDFLALRAGRLTRSAYRDLLQRLWGFHAGLHRHLAIGGAEQAARIARLRQDLLTLGVTETQVDVAPLASFDDVPGEGPGALGAAYVQDGSALGGTVLARALDPLLGRGCLDGRRFFTPTPGLSAAWRDRLAEIEIVARQPVALEQMIAGASTTFAVFEAFVGAEGADAGRPIGSATLDAYGPTTRIV